MKLIQPVIAIAVLAMTNTACSKSQKAHLPQKAPAMEASKNQAKNQPNQTEQRLMGQVYSPGKMLLAFQTPGTITRLIAKPGMSFKKGQLLAELDSRDITLRVQAAKLRYEQALNQKKLAKRDYEVEKELYAKEISSQLQFENLQTNYENTDLSAKMAEVDWKVAEKALSDTKLTAPFDCVVTRQLKVLGESSMGGSEGNTSYEIFETSSVEIRLQAPESLLGTIKIGDKMTVELPALKIKIPAHVARYVPVISEQTRNFLVVAEPDKPDAKIVPGYFAEGVLK